MGPEKKFAYRQFAYSANPLEFVVQAFLRLHGLGKRSVVTPPAGNLPRRCNLAGRRRNACTTTRWSNRRIRRIPEGGGFHRIHIVFRCTLRVES